MKRLVILGTGGYGQTVADVASQLSVYNEILFLDDNSTHEMVVGKCSDYADIPVLIRPSVYASTW